ncbi:MAG: DUF2335 domain-containing protein [Burkholderiales bacterium]|nr:DUF2335 domain-containing protein [Burkholderiales bacterium]
MLREFDAVLPGTAEKLIRWAEEESAHRRSMESSAQAANIMNQSRHLEIVHYQSRATFRSDFVGQICGFIVCIACVVGAIWMGALGHEVAAGALCAIPTAAVIQAFRVGLFKKNKPSAPNTSKPNST